MKDHIEKITREAVATIGEFADSVQILVTHQEGGQTHRYFLGGGNWYARLGMAHEFITCSESETSASELADKLKTRDTDQD